MKQSELYHSKEASQKMDVFCSILTQLFPTFILILIVSSQAE